MTATALKATGLERTQGTFHLDHLDFELPTGLVMGFVGPNGAGKTTTIKSILGMLELDSGTIDLFGDAKPGDASTKERIGVVLDQPFVSPDWKVGSLTRRAGRFFAGWDDARFRGLLGRFGVPVEARVGTLSRVTSAGVVEFLDGKLPDAHEHLDAARADILAKSRFSLVPDTDQEATEPSTLELSA